MPTVLRMGRYRIVIYMNDHKPAHVHITGEGHEVLLHLNCPAGPVSVRENYGFAEHTVNALMKQLREHVSSLCVKWESLHDRT